MTRRGLFRYRDDGGCLEVSWNDILAQTCRLSHQDVEEMEVELSKPINLPNDRLLFESHHWISLRTPGDSHFFLATKTGYFSREDWTDHGDQYKYFWPNHDVFLTLTKWF